jgi:hypothetical protein
MYLFSFISFFFSRIKIIKQTGKYMRVYILKVLSCYLLFFLKKKEITKERKRERETKVIIILLYLGKGTS